MKNEKRGRKRNRPAILVYNVETGENIIFDNATVQQKIKRFFVFVPQDNITIEFPKDKYTWKEL